MGNYSGVKSLQFWLLIAGKCICGVIVVQTNCLLTRKNCKVERDKDRAWCVVCGGWWSLIALPSTTARFITSQYLTNNFTKFNNSNFCNSNL